MMFLIIIGVILILLFTYSACVISSKCSRFEEQEEKKKFCKKVF